MDSSEFIEDGSRSEAACQRPQPRPQSVEGVLKARAAHPDARLLGGGTDLMVNIRRGIVAPPVLIDMTAVAELRFVEADA